MGGLRAQRGGILHHTIATVVCAQTNLQPFEGGLRSKPFDQPRSSEDERAWVPNCLTAVVNTHKLYACHNFLQLKVPDCHIIQALVIIRFTERIDGVSWAFNVMRLFSFGFYVEPPLEVSAVVCEYYTTVVILRYKLATHPSPIHAVFRHRQDDQLLSCSAAICGGRSSPPHVC